MSYRYQKSNEINYYIVVIYSALLSFGFYAIFRNYLYIVIPVSLMLSYFYQNAKRDKIQFLEIDKIGVRFSYVDFILKEIHPDLLWENVTTIDIIIERQDRYFVIEDKFKNRYYLPDIGNNFSETYLNLIKFAKENNPNIKLLDWKENTEIEISENKK